ncbi:putative glycosyltransferase [Tolypothrix tenuis PCC 7101]|uniref:Putative glycosyltransferase n=1 Tax=Tolypothrix tenuis PCC 7101 TaxID=231146 RepID=A0A1Z4MVV8_9CYAN|nr:glycosyltransferase [Aulosira sp. FACHB-113]BAY97626.1 putative glycosyltransferase [Tolypothrix tenuis PCC 7101]BAZ71866.1 putative glycosyltransferase [Aulosira laxa NIES-50]
MKIAFVVGYFPVLSETFIVNQIIGLIDRGHDVDIYAYQPGNTSQLHPDIIKYQLLGRTKFQPSIPQNFFWRLLKAVKLIIANFHKSPLVLLRSLNVFKYGRWAASLRLLYSVIPLLNTETYDIIHCQFGTLAREGMAWRDMGAIKGKLITSFRGYDISWFIHEYGEHIYDELFTKGDFFLANCKYFQTKAIRIGCEPQKIVVHGSGIDCSQFQLKKRLPPEPNGKIYLATTCRLIPKKGTEYSIRAVAKVAKIYPDIEYNIIGDGYLRDELAQLIQDLNVTAQVKLLGWKNQPAIIEVLDQAHIFLAPSITSDDGNQDAPLNTLKEAMAMGLPVISTQHGGIPELVEDGISGFLVPERDVDAIAEKLTYLIKHPEIWSQMGAAGRAYVETHYDMNKLNDELVQIYQQVIANNLPLLQPTLAVAGRLNYEASGS